MAVTDAPRPYHHGDLYRALLQAAETVLNEQGITGVTLREVARQAGVSHNAPYNHFADKAELIATLVKSGFERFAADLRNADATTPGSAMDKLMAVGVAYVLFARTHPGLFRLMFRPELRQSEKFDPHQPWTIEMIGEDDAFRVLVDGLARCQAEGLAPQEEVLTQALTAWSLVHGLAELMLDGPAGAFVRTPEAATALAEHALTIFRWGLQVR